MTSPRHQQVRTETRRGQAIAHSAREGPLPARPHPSVHPEAQPPAPDVFVTVATEAASRRGWVLTGKGGGISDPGRPRGFQGPAPRLPHVHGHSSRAGAQQQALPEGQGGTEQRGRRQEGGGHRPWHRGQCRARSSANGPVIPEVTAAVPLGNCRVTHGELPGTRRRTGACGTHPARSRGRAPTHPPPRPGRIRLLGKLPRPPAGAQPPPRYPGRDREAPPCGPRRSRCEGGGGTEEPGVGREGALRARKRGRGGRGGGAVARLSPEVWVLKTDPLLVSTCSPHDLIPSQLQVRSARGSPQGGGEEGHEAWGARGWRPRGQGPTQSPGTAGEKGAGGEGREPSPGRWLGLHPSRGPGSVAWAPPSTSAHGERPRPPQPGRGSGPGSGASRGLGPRHQHRGCGSSAEQREEGPCHEAQSPAGKDLRF